MGNFMRLQVQRKMNYQADRRGRRQSLGQRGNSRSVSLRRQQSLDLVTDLSLEKKLLAITLATSSRLIFQPASTFAIFSIPVEH